MGCGPVVASGDAGPRPDTAPPACWPDGGSHVYIAYEDPGAIVECPSLGPVSSEAVMTRHAAITEVDDENGAHLALDFCSPAADCVPQPGALTVRAPELRFADGSAALRVGQFVEIRWHMRSPYQLGGCTREIEISNLPEWDGEPNPVRSDSALLVAAANGVPTTLPDAPLELWPESTGCRPEAPASCGRAREAFRFVFQGSCAACATAPEPVRVEQGAHAQITIDERPYDVRNHQSVVSGFCDDSGSFDWTVREAAVE